MGCYKINSFRTCSILQRFMGLAPFRQHPLFFFYMKLKWTLTITIASLDFWKYAHYYITWILKLSLFETHSISRQNNEYNIDHLMVLTSSAPCHLPVLIPLSSLECPHSYYTSSTSAAVEWRQGQSAPGICSRNNLSTVIKSFFLWSTISCL